MKPYYYVYCRSTRTPTMKHETLEDAVEEAERLAEKHVGLSFEVLKAVAISSVQRPASTFYMGGESPDDADPSPTTQNKF